MNPHSCTPMSAAPQGAEQAAMLSEQLRASYYSLQGHVARLGDELRQARSEQAEQLARAERLSTRLQALLNSLPAGVVVLDGAGVVQEANPAAQQLLGEPLQGIPWREVTLRAFAAPHPGEADLPLHSGRWVSLSTCPLGAEPGQIIQLEDVTERRRLAEGLQRHRRLADMGRMAANLAHQIRTPLSTALLYVSQLSARMPAERLERFAGKAEKSLRELERLISDMLLFARGGGEQREALDPVALLAGAVEPLRESLQRDGIEVLVEGHGSRLLQGNPTLLRSALVNLIGNAARAMPAGGRLMLSARLVDRGQVVLAVADEGEGVPAAIAGRLFEPFVSGQPGGTGLGLAVVRAIAVAHGGEALYRPGEQGGSVFELWLPVAADDAGVQNTAAATNDEVPTETSDEVLE